jgi:hypothetical protein
MREVTPRVVRVIDVPSASTLPEIHELLQAGIGWTDSHLHSFTAGDDVRFGPPSDDLDWLRDETDATLRDLPARFVYTYDFGDNWEHDVEILGSGGARPGLVEGEGACPPEDVGGGYGYTEFREAMADPTHPDHDRMRTWASGWSWSPDFADDDRATTDALVRDVAGQVPATVRLLLDLIGEKVKLTATGRLPRALVRTVQEQRPDWYLPGYLASTEDDLIPLSYLHDALRRVGVLRVARGVLSPTKAAADDLQVIRRLRRILEPESFDDILVGVATAELIIRGTTTTRELATAVLPYTERWSINGRPITPHDVGDQLGRLSRHMEALDLADNAGWQRWAPGPSARTLIPRATHLAHLWRHRAPDQPG